MERIVNICDLNIILFPFALICPNWLLAFFLVGCSRENKSKFTYYYLFEILRKQGLLKPTHVESSQILLHKIL